MLTPIKTPFVIKKLGKSMVWDMPRGDNCLYLTFDDGPIDEVTPWVLDLLAEYNAKATFFCVGENVEKNPLILQRMVNEGHSIGNHTYNHLNGWRTKNRTYLRNVAQTQQILKTNIFRPPYGKLKPSQLKTLRKHYRIIMWSLLTQDYDNTITPEKCLENSLQATAGDIVLFHDSLKARNNLEYILPRFLKFYRDSGFNFSTIF